MNNAIHFILEEDKVKITLIFKRSTSSLVSSQQTKAHPTTLPVSQSVNQSINQSINQSSIDYNWQFHHSFHNIFDVSSSLISAFFWPQVTPYPVQILIS